MSGGGRNIGIQLIEAVRNGEEDLIVSLIEQHANLNMTDSDDESALHVAALRGDWKSTERLLEGDAWVDVIGAGGKTPLHIAAARGDHRIVKLLLENGADANSKARPEAELVTPLLLAAEISHYEVMKELIEKDADVNDCDSSAYTALHNIIRRGGDEKCVELLIQSRADVNLTHHDRATPLLMACEKGQRTIVEKLLHAGARTDIKDIFGRSPLDRARRKGFREIVELLENHKIKLSKRPGEEDAGSSYKKTRVS